MKFMTYIKDKVKLICHRLQNTLKPGLLEVRHGKVLFHDSEAIFKNIYL